MRLVSGLLTLAFATLLPGAARADEPAAVASEPAPTPAVPAPAVSAPTVALRVVKLMPATHQALLFDRAHQTHVLVALGGQVDGFSVTEIDDDAVVLTSATTSVILAAPDQPWKHRSHTHEQDQATPPPAEPPAVATSAPAMSPSTAPTAPVDPYADVPLDLATVPAGIIREVEAPLDEQAPPPTTPVLATPTPTPTPIPPPPLAPPLAPLTHGDLIAALGNFAALSQTLRAHFTPTGVQLDTLAPASIFERAGLRAGDTIVAVDNRPLRGLDDAAELYARAATARAFRVQIVRSDRPMTLDVILP
jgi:membrane-associated protease RseP (regulator of RpoE activity)